MMHAQYPSNLTASLPKEFPAHLSTHLLHFTLRLVPDKSKDNYGDLLYRLIHLFKSVFYLFNSCCLILLLFWSIFEPMNIKKYPFLTILNHEGSLAIHIFTTHFSLQLISLSVYGHFWANFSKWVFLQLCTFWKLWLRGKVHNFKK